MLPIKRRRVVVDRPKSIESKSKKVKHVEKPASSDSASPETEPKPKEVEPETDDIDEAAQGDKETEAPKSFKDLVRRS